MGRPPIPPEHKMSARIAIQVTDSEKEKIKKDAESAGFYTISNYIRAKLGLDS